MNSITLRFMAQPGPDILGDTVRGGAILKWIEEAGFACAMAWSGRMCMTVYVGGVRFARRIRIGEVVEVQARMAGTGQHSMNVAVEVRASDIRLHGLEHRGEKVAECLVVFVAIDEEGNALPAPPWLPETPGDIALAQRIMAQLDAAEGIRPADL